MEEELEVVKNTIRCLVVSSRTEVNVRLLVRDYLKVVGKPLPFTKFGYKTAVSFLKHKCSDEILLLGPLENPLVKLIISDPNKCNELIKQTKQNLMQFEVGESSKIESNAISKNLSNKRCVFGKKNKTKNMQPSKYLPDNNNNNEFEKNFKHGARPKQKSNTVETINNNCMMMRQRVADMNALKTELVEVIETQDRPVLSNELIHLYRERYGRDLNFSRFGYSSIGILASNLPGITSLITKDGTECVLLGQNTMSRPPPPPKPPAPVNTIVETLNRYPKSIYPKLNPEDALPGIDYDPDVFPNDSMQMMDEVASQNLSDIKPGDIMPVIIGEVYSPSHFWVMRLGNEHYEAVDRVMVEMTKYYTYGEGRERRLSRGAVRVGYCCTSIYDGDWHRSVIVNIIDDDRVKVFHLDYGTVDVVPTISLKPLLKRWATLPAQALRMRLAGIKPRGDAPYWSHATSSFMLEFVINQSLIANVVAVNTEERIMEALLIDTTACEDILLSDKLVLSGFADSRRDAALNTGESHLYPSFEALETGAAPSYFEIHNYLLNGLVLEYIDDFRRHMPYCSTRKALTGYYTGFPTSRPTLVPPPPGFD